MLKEATYKEKFQILKKWMPEIADSVKKELKNDHLKKDWMFAKKYFAGKNLNKITTSDLADGYVSAIANEEKAEEIGEFISSCWLLKNGEIYHYFEEELKKINPDFSSIEKLDPADSKKIALGAAEEFGAFKTYVFSILNSVAFQDAELKQLESFAEKDLLGNKVKEEAEEKHQSIEGATKAFDLKLARLTDKYEKKILGLQKKYTEDVGAYKKQIAILQAKLNQK